MRDGRRPQSPARSAGGSAGRAPMTGRCATSLGWATAASAPAPETFAQRSGNIESPAPFNSRLSRVSPLLWRFFEDRHARQLKQTVAVDVSFDVACQAIEGLLDVGFVDETGRAVSNTPQPMIALAVVGKKPVNVATGDVARRADRPLFSSIGEMQKRSRAARPGRAPD